MSDNILKKQQENSNQNNSGIIAAEYSGPIPPPNILAGYDKINPGFADRVIKLAEKEQEHQHENDNTIIKYIHSENVESLRLGAILSALLMIIGAYIILKSPSNVACVVAGSLFGLSGIGTIIASLFKRSSDEKNNESQNRNSQ